MIDPFFLDVWDPFGAGNSPFSREIGKFPRDDATTIANTQLDWKETSNAHILKANLPGIHLVYVRVSIPFDEGLCSFS